jgi:hypothetical protein
MRLAPAFFVIQIRSAGRAQPTAIASADGLHRDRQQHLFDQHIR